MKKVAIKILTLVLAFLFSALPILIISLFCITPILKDFTKKTTIGGTYYYNNPVLTFKYNNAMSGYRIAKDILSKENAFYDLILDNGAHIREIVDCGDNYPKLEYAKDGHKNVYITNGLSNDYPSCSEIYYPAIKESGYAELLKGRWINTENVLSNNNPVEIMVSEQSKYDVGSSVWLITTLEDKNENAVILPATVVGIIKLNYAIPRAGKQNTKDLELLKNAILVQNPLDEYSFEYLDGYNGYSNNKEDNINYYEGVSFKIAIKENGTQIANDTIIKAATLSDASIYTNYAYNSVNNEIEYNKQSIKLLIVSTLLLLTSIVETILIIIKIIKLSIRKKENAEAISKDDN